MRNLVVTLTRHTFKISVSNFDTDDDASSAFEIARVVTILVTHTVAKVAGI
jgi:hypothetical protein